MTPHRPIRPLWLCRRCSAPWPCGQAKLDLLRQHHDNPHALLAHLDAAMRDASDDLTTLWPHQPPTPADIWHRFIGWTRHTRERGDNAPL